MTNLKHIIWDWNGTLLNDLQLCVNIMNSLLTERNKPTISVARYQDIFDFPIKDYYERAGIDFNSEPWEKISIDFIERYNDLRYGCDLHSQSKAFIRDLKQQGISHSILSAREQLELLNDVSHYSLSSFFDHICGIEDHYGASKVHIAHKLFAQLGLSKSEIIMVGDTSHDAEVAGEMGINCVLISHGHHSAEKLENTGAKVVPSFTGLAEYLNQNS
jgi:phosphoglycolate phosphatase